jgi:hypothetical protein
MMRRLEDWLLWILQRRCSHPGKMVAADLLGGCHERLKVRYCRRCGAVKTEWDPHGASGGEIVLPHWWRSPDPYLYKVRGSRLLWHRRTERWTDKAGARRFAKKWGCPMQEPREAPAETPQGEVLDGE